MGLGGYKPRDQSSTILFRPVGAKARWTFRMDYSRWLADRKEQINELMAAAEILERFLRKKKKKIKN